MFPREEGEEGLAEGKLMDLTPLFCPQSYYPYLLFLLVMDSSPLLSQRLALLDEESDDEDDSDQIDLSLVAVIAIPLLARMLGKSFMFLLLRYSITK